jgi:uncharacterized membrane protein (UPF0136 family)
MIFSGFIGYLTAKSRPSLIAGTIAGILLIIAGYITAGGNHAAGFYMGLVISIALIVVFVMRFAKTRAFMPSGMLALVNIVALLVLLFNR